MNCAACDRSNEELEHDVGTDEVHAYPVDGGDEIDLCTECLARANAPGGQLWLAEQMGWAGDEEKGAA